MKRLSLLLSILLAIRAMHSAAGADLGGDEIVQRLRQTAAREVPYGFGTIAQVTIVPDKQSARLAYSDNPEGVREVLIGEVRSSCCFYCVLSSGTVTGGGSTVGKSVGAFRQVVAPRDRGLAGQG